MPANNNLIPKQPHPGEIPGSEVPQLTLIEQRLGSVAEELVRFSAKQAISEALNMEPPIVLDQVGRERLEEPGVFRFMLSRIVTAHKADGTSTKWLWNDRPIKGSPHYVFTVERPESSRIEPGADIATVQGYAGQSTRVQDSHEQQETTHSQTDVYADVRSRANKNTQRRRMQRKRVQVRRRLGSSGS